jgi:hypothetical protein
VPVALTQELVPAAFIDRVHPPLYVRRLAATEGIAMAEPDAYATVRDVLVSVKSETDPISADRINLELELGKSPLALDSLELLGSSQESRSASA